MESILKIHEGDEPLIGKGSLHPVKPAWLLEIRDPREDNALLIRIGYDGSTETGENHNPDRAAEVFWEALGNEQVIREWCARRGFELSRAQEEVEPRAD